MWYDVSPWCFPMIFFMFKNAFLRKPFPGSNCGIFASENWELWVPKLSRFGCLQQWWAMMYNGGWGSSVPKQCSFKGAYLQWTGPNCLLRITQQTNFFGGNKLPQASWVFWESFKISFFFECFWWHPFWVNSQIPLFWAPGRSLSFRVTRMVWKENSDKSLLKMQIRYCIDIHLYIQMSTQFLYKWLPKSIFVCFSFADFARANIQHFWASQQLVAILDDDFTFSKSSVCTTHRLFRYARLMRLELYFLLRLPLPLLLMISPLQTSFKNSPENFSGSVSGAVGPRTPW